MTYEQVLRFRDKDKMKQAVADAGLRTPKHQRAASPKDCFAAAEQVGFPLCLKPVAGAGSADTYRVDSMADLESLVKTAHIGDSNLEEWIEAEEFTYDTICIDGKPVFENISWYRPRPLVGRSIEWIGPTCRAAASSATRCSRRSVTARASRTWSGTARLTARWCSARSPRARPARTRWTR
jgi:hypothetical protein